MNIPSACLLLERLLIELSPRYLFPVLDLLRCCVLKADVCSFYTESNGHLLLGLLRMCLQKGLQYASAVMAIRVMQNMFANAVGAQYMMSFQALDVINSFISQVGLCYRRLLCTNSSTMPSLLVHQRFVYDRLCLPWFTIAACTRNCWRMTRKRCAV